MEEALIARLLAAPGVAAMVGPRLYPGRRPQASALPAATLIRISGAPVYTDQGEAGLASARVQIDCWGESYAAAKLTARAVIAALSAFAGLAGGVTFQNILLDAERDFSEGGSNAADYLFRTTLDFIVWHQT
ncbi:MULTISPECIES: DUF3168 domain-containing protein [Rhodomicrobium]|uniref:DUF3168 domain-containing protein n=1 Tax=Rhodomicrobium TaxID=1068 RepID=UPI000B4BB826|nr:MULTISPECIES: DUF3168 domain-containing protein [Rhodomicrobium]